MSNYASKDNFSIQTLYFKKGGQVDLSSFEAKAQDYVKRAEVLKTETHQAALDLARKAHDASGEYERAKFCLVEALGTIHV